MPTDECGLNGCRVLVVEDELLIAMDVENFLLDLGIEVLPTAPTVALALEHIERHCPDMVILDRNLDGEPTTVVAEELNRLRIPFVVVTGYVHGVSDDPALAHAACIQKPWRADELLTRLREMRPDPVRRRQA